MSSAAEEEEAAARETALSQDILHCPHNDEDSEPLQKKMCLSSEEQDDSDAAEFAVVTLPSEKNTYLTDCV
ncbi:hypothetical protein CgunFtcFv8_027773 [Champsocephalus gunnari]|uniref:Uncharacterized protein n=1 Tax=Champsocephalus gunnari TaxID=52237 RepID=A0AAN8I2F9_CHAGU|nr:hypothetical protein CgunFtcFv8_027818 [Champsocephalus gunnari]KAK5936158.1 hypothetical protein CgunFtcFv8_027773 [Champsocephalus gunnari]